ncbi:MAG TPA: hypothetical protein VMB05_07550 [Solirubrobacteraceae bacterium]|nr:hypothetical protein [Solirubrobacteraceae bacterium]HUB74468.1 hypothetical protein [Solirubrobacteraceae bacterium]
MQESPAPDAIPDDLLLAALERAERHDQRTGRPDWAILEHLDIPRRGGKAREVKRQLLALVERGLLEHGRSHGVVLFLLTPKAKRRLRRLGAEVTDLLPESPQHKTWRNARTYAELEEERFHLSLRTSLEEAMGMLDEMTMPVAPGPSSDAWLELADRLHHALRRQGSLRYCLYEWEEPDDARADVDEHSDPSDAEFSEEERKRRQARRSGRRNVRLWRYRGEELESEGSDE